MEIIINEQQFNELSDIKTLLLKIKQNNVLKHQRATQKFNELCQEASKSMKLVLEGKAPHHKG